MRTSWYLSFSLIILSLTGCGTRGLYRMLRVASPAFTASTIVDAGGMRVQARLCSHQELQRYFSAAEDMYHYYHLLHVRLENQSVVRYTLQADKCSFFVPPDTLLRRYTRSNRGSIASLVAMLNAVLFFPIYVISMFKAAVESPPYLMNPDLVVPRPFGLLSAVYGFVTLGPFFIGQMAANSASESYYKEAKQAILTQRRQLSIPPYKTVDTLILTPRAGFTSPCSIALYNHKSHELEQAVLAV